MPVLATFLKIHVKSPQERNWHDQESDVGRYITRRSDIMSEVNQVGAMSVRCRSIRVVGDWATGKNCGEATGDRPSQSDYAHDNTPDGEFPDNKDPMIEEENGKLHGRAGGRKDDRYCKEIYEIGW